MFIKRSFRSLLLLQFAYLKCLPKITPSFPCRFLISNGFHNKLNFNQSSMQQTIILKSRVPTITMPTEETRLLNQFLIDEKYHTAIEQCCIALSNNSKNSLHIRYILAQALKESGLITESNKEFQRLLTEAVSQESSNYDLISMSHFELAHLNNFIHDIQSSLFHAEKAMELNEELIVNRFVIFYYESNQQERGIQFFSKLLAISPTNQCLLNFKGILYQSQEKFQEAIQIFQKILELPHDPIHEQVNLRLGVIHKILGNYSLGKQYLETYLNLNPTDPESYFHLAVCYEQLHDFKKSIEFFQKNLDHFPEHVATIQKLIDIYSEEGDKKKTMKYVKMIAKIDPALKENEDYQRILERLERILEIIQSNNNEQESQKVENDNVIELFKKLADSLHDFHRKPSDVVLYLQPLFNSFTTLFVKLERFDLAIESEKQLLIISPDSLQHRLNLAIMYRNNQEFKSSLDVYQSLKKSYPDNSYYSYICGQIYLQFADLHNAIKEYKIALLNESPNDCYCLFELKCCYRLEREKDLEKETQTKLLQIYPDFYEKEEDYIMFICLIINNNFKIDS